MAQILSIYGLVASVIISGSIKEKMAIYTGFMQLGAGLAVGLCGMAAGFAIGIVGDAGGESCLLTWKRKVAKADQVYSSCKYAAAALVRWNGAHPNLCRGPGTVRSHRFHSDAHALQARSHRVFVLSSKRDQVSNVFDCKSSRNGHFRNSVS